MVTNTTRISIALAALVLAITATRWALASDDDSTTGKKTLRGREQEVLRTLMLGSPDERFQAADRICNELRLCFSPPRTADQSLDDLIDGLILVLRQETDDWIARTLLEFLVWDRNPGMDNVFREALRSSSINVQAMGVRRFAYHKNPEAVELLEAVWKHGHPPWMRPELIQALAKQGSSTQLEDFMRLTRDDEAATRKAAIEALDALALPEAIPVLIRVSRSGAERDRAAAIEALGAFPDSDEALQEALRASRSNERSVLWAAVRALGRLGRPDGDDRLIALLDVPPNPNIRSSIAEALQDSEHTDATPALVRLLHQADIGLDDWIAATAVRVLHNRDDAGAIPGLLDLTGDPESRGANEIDNLIAYLSRDRSKTKRSVRFTTSCSMRVISAEDPDVWHVAPAPPLETIRCWEGPDRAGDPVYDPRVPAGTLVRIADHFEAPGRHWVEIEGSGHDCWLPLDDLEKGPGPPESLSWPRRHIRHEFDIGTDDLESPLADRLYAAGLLYVFVPGGEVAGITLELDALDADQIEFLRGSLSEADSVLNAAIRFVLRQVDPASMAAANEDDEDFDPEDEDYEDDAD